MLDAPWREAILAHAARRQAAARHLPGAAVPVRGQHRGAGPAGAGAAARPLRQARSRVGSRRWRSAAEALGRVQGAARRLERREPDARRRRSSPASRRARRPTSRTRTRRRSATRRRRRRRHGPNTFASVVERGAIFGLQFHPEKSGDAGLADAPQFLRTGPRRSAGSHRESLRWSAFRAEERGRKCAPRVEADHRVPRRPRRTGRQGREVRGPALGRRSGGAGGALQRRGHRRGRHPRRHGDARDAARAGAARSARWRATCSSRSPSAAASAPKTTRRRSSTPAPTRSA